MCAPITIVRSVATLLVILSIIFCSEASTNNQSTINWCDRESGVVKLNPAPTNTSLVFVNLLKDFANLTIVSEDARSDALTMKKVIRVLILEFFTDYTGNFFVLPRSDKPGYDWHFYQRVHRIFTRYLNLTTAVRFEDALLTACRKRKTKHNEWHGFKNMLTVGNFAKLRDVVKETMMDTLYPGHRYNGFQGDGSVPSKESTTYFPYQRLREENIVNESNVAEWLNNINIRKLLIHEQFLAARKKPDERSDYEKTRAILSVGKQEPEMRCLYDKVLEECAADFQASYPKELVDSFRTKLWETVTRNARLSEQVLGLYNTEITSAIVSPNAS